MDMILSRASVPSLGREATPELERRPFDQDLRARLETMEIDPPDATTRFQHRLKQYYKWTDEFAARTLDGFWRFLRILTLVVKLRYFAISGGLSSPELRRRLNQSSAGQGDVFRVGAGLSEHFHSVREGRGGIDKNLDARAAEGEGRRYRRTETKSLSCAKTRLTTACAISSGSSADPGNQEEQPDGMDF